MSKNEIKKLGKSPTLLVPPSQNTHEEKRDVPPPPLQRSPPREDIWVLHERQSVLGREHSHKNRLKKDSFKNTSTERGQHSGKGEERLEGGRSQTRV